MALIIHAIIHALFYDVRDYTFPTKITRETTDLTSDEYVHGVLAKGLQENQRSPSQFRRRRSSL